MAISTLPFEEIKKLYLQGLSAGDIALLLGDIKKISGVKRAITKMKSLEGEITISAAEEKTRKAPSRVGKSQAADRAYTEVKKKYSQELLDKTKEFTSDSKYKTKTQVENALYKYFNKPEYKNVPDLVPNKAVAAFFRPSEKVFNIPEAFEVYGGEFGKRKNSEKRTALRHIIGTNFFANSKLPEYDEVRASMTEFYTKPESKLSPKAKKIIRRFNNDFSITRSATRGSGDSIVTRFFVDEKGFDFSRKVKDFRKIWTTSEGLQELIDDANTSEADRNFYKTERSKIVKNSNGILKALKEKAPALFTQSAAGGSMQLEHRVARALGETGDMNLPKNYIARASYVPGEFNRAKFYNYDEPLMKLIAEYNAGDKSKRIEIEKLTKDFNKKSKGFLNNVGFKFKDKVTMTDSTPLLSTRSDADTLFDIDKNIKSSDSYFKSFGDERPKGMNLKSVGSDFVTGSDDYLAFKKLVSAVKKAPQACRKILNYQTGGISTTCAVAIENDPVGAANKLTELDNTGPLAKVKNAASTFLNVAKKGGRFGAFAAAGAAAAGLVKEFRNDDPSTYLSSENQQKNMLIDMLEQPIVTPTETPSTALGDATLPAIGAVTAAGMIPGGAELYKQRTGAGSRKRTGAFEFVDDKGAKVLQKRVSPFRAATGPLSGVLGKGLAATGTPLGMLALEPLYIGQQIAEGDSFGEIATNPINYLGPAFAGSLSKEATRFAGPKMANLMRLGISPTTLKTVSRRFGLPGLALSAGVSGYEMYQNKKAGRGLFDDG